MSKVNEKKVVIYATHKDHQLGLELRNKLQADGKQPVIQNPDFMAGPIKDAGKVVVFGRKGHPTTDKVMERYEDQKTKVEVKESPSLEKADKQQEARKGEGGGKLNLPAPTEQENVSQIKGWLDYMEVDYKSDANKDDLLKLVRENS